jgi:hypothetical protein
MSSEVAGSLWGEKISVAWGCAVFVTSDNDLRATQWTDAGKRWKTNFCKGGTIKRQSDGTGGASFALQSGKGSRGFVSQ